MKKDLISKKLIKCESKIEKNRIFKKDSSYFKSEDNVFDIPTLKALSTFVNNKIISSFYGSISTGKEANVFYAIKNTNDIKEELAVKIYRINSSTFKSMNPYLLNDTRFLNIKHKKKDIIFSWAQKEYQNLLRLYKIGVNVPKPIKRERNIVVMEFIGENGISYPQLRFIHLNNNVANIIFDSIIKTIRKMYQIASLVHSDLSEYNILVNPKTFELTIIDVGQSVMVSHPKSSFFLKRDILNILNYFKKYDIF